MACTLFPYGVRPLPVWRAPSSRMAYAHHRMAYAFTEYLRVVGLTAIAIALEANTRFWGVRGDWEAKNEIWAHASAPLRIFDGGWIVFGRKRTKNN